MKASWLGLLCSLPLLAQGWGRSEARLPWLQGNFRQAERAFAQWRSTLPQALIWEAEFETERARFGQAETLLKEAKKTETPDSQGLADRRRARLLFSVGQYSDALQMLLKGQRWDGKDVHKLKVSSVIDLITIGEVYVAKGKFPEAIAILERARDQAKKVSSLDGLEWAQAVNDIAIASLALGQLPAASQAASLVLSSAERQWGAASIPAMDALDTVGLVHLAESKFADAEAAFLLSRTWRENLYGTMHPKVAASYLHAGLLALAQKNDAEAVRQITNALEIEKSLAVGGPNGRWALNLVSAAGALANAGKVDLAKDCYQSAIPVLTRELGPDAPRLDDARNRYAGLTAH